jgi:tRNA isopentenyl-2-thiomethyl-A-37 hydroxylase MiaE
MDLGEHNYKFKYKKIEDIWYIIVALSDSTFSSIECSTGAKGRYVLSGEAMMSAINTIVAIDFCCGRGAYSDAYALIRKYRDDLMQYLFVLNVIKNIKGITEEELSAFFLEPESMIKMIEKDFQILTSGERKNASELAMESWMYNDLESNEHSEMRRKFFDTSKYKDYLMSANKHVDVILNKFLATVWKSEDRKLNNYVHTNGIKYLMDNYVYQPNKEQRDKELIESIYNITDIFLSLLSVIDSTKLRSTDYLDALEMNMQPEEGSQYWVLPCVVEYMNDRFNTELLNYIQNNEGNGMRFMTDDYMND